jgi:hypothetical protein
LDGGVLVVHITLEDSLLCLTNRRQHTRLSIVITIGSHTEIDFNFCRIILSPLCEGGRMATADLVCNSQSKDFVWWHLSDICPEGKRSGLEAAPHSLGRPEAASGQHFSSHTASELSMLHSNSKQPISYFHRTGCLLFQRWAAEERRSIT